MMKLARAKKDVGIYGLMAKWYDKNSRKNRLMEWREYADETTRHTALGASILELAPGPGYLSVELAKKGYHVTGVEISPDFVRISKHNAAEAGVRVDFLQGNASELPCDNETFDFIICTAAFKNFKEPVKVLNEMFRVLKPGGKTLIVDMNREATDEDLDAEVDKANMKGFDRWFVRLSFKTFLRQSAYTAGDIERFINSSSFGRGVIKKVNTSLYVYCNKS